ncbi:glycosyltransferase family 4 protein [Pseudomonas sp. GD04087]|uniref:glycosyltransferase family 4 protein n=1 Tax=unclassified Pseudomonas TaxID=196821 RepID=UPI00244D0430|nr:MULTISPECIES: glycosyltransferase family 4 protein [unclassified Pseudomonas]MDH0287775.1 glycosyltransferase family 4 protein [Pseudomonas sp. GD04087]MDH1050800.1 glycosyltransferase family 4 protein [Pseudomonas sp. GD03903]MDH2002782.1 glycosyltransferase family 4 protein [Pseudomonas sp. GD03691]
MPSVSFKKLAIVSTQAFSLINFRGDLISFLVRRGVQVFALAPDYDESTERAIRGLGGVPVVFCIDRVAINPLSALKVMWDLGRIFRSLQVDAVLSYFAKPVIYAGIAARVVRVPRIYSMIEGAGYVFSDDSLRTLRKKFLRLIVGRLYWLSLRYSHRVFLLNQDDYKLFVHGGLVQADKVKLLPGIGVDLQRYCAVRPLVNPITFVFMGRLLKEKGICDFIEAARKVRLKYNSQVRFVVVGDVDLNPGSIRRDAVIGWEREGLIQWVGHVNDVRHWLARASVFVLPSFYREGLPRSIQEAMATGLPIITTNWVGCRETIEDGRNGFLVPIRDPVSLANAMERFILEPVIIFKMGLESRLLAESRFNVHKINRQIVASM